MFESLHTRTIRRDIQEGVKRSLWYWLCKQVAFSNFPVFVALEAEVPNKLNAVFLRNTHFSRAMQLLGQNHYEATNSYHKYVKPILLDISLDVDLDARTPGWRVKVS